MAEREAAVRERAVLFGPFRLVAGQRLLLEGDRVVGLGSRALDVLIALIDRPGELVSKDELMARVWPGTIVEEGNLKVQIAALRRALGDGKSGKRYLATMPGRGYCFVCPVTFETVEPKAGDVSPAKHGSNLPARLGRLIGRADQVSKIAQQLLHQRLVTIVGPGGIGKTSVALAVADALIGDYEHGVWFVDLTPIGDDRLVPNVLAAVLGLEIRSADPVPVLLNNLRDRCMLIVLDNCEHVVEGAAQLSVGILRSASGISILATSREPLLVQGEYLHRLSPLAVASTKAPLTAAEALAFPAVELLVERATESSSDFEFRDADASVIVDICRRLDGIPLAIELAAARVTALGVRGLASLLEDHLRPLTRGRRGDPPRHQTMRATLDWSYGLLSDVEQKILRRLAIFAGSFTLDAASTVVADAPEDQVADLLQALVAKSLVVADVGGYEPRYRLLEITRAYAREKLVAAGESDTLSQRHAEYYRDLLATGSPPAGDVAATDWLTKYGPEIDNVRAALVWAFSPQGNAAIAVGVAAASASLWIEMSRLGECSSWMEAAIAMLDDAAATGTRQEMGVQTAFGLSLMYTGGSTSTARAALIRASELAESYQDLDYQLRTLSALALFSIRLEGFEDALSLARRAEAIAKGISDAAAVSKVHCVIGLTLFFTGEYATALPHLHRAYRRITANDRRAQIVRSGMDYSILARCIEAQIFWLQGLLDQSAQMTRDILADAKQAGHPASLCQALAWCGCRIPLRLGDLDTAEQSIALLKDIAKTHGFSSYLYFALGYEGQLSAERGDPIAGEALLRACLEGLRNSQYENIYTAFLGILAAILTISGNFTGGLAAIEEVLARTESNHGFWWRPEALRIKGEVLLVLNETEPRAAEESFRHSLDLAKQQKALTWELRAATSLARLWQHRGRRREAHRLLASVYERFSEGFETKDLKAARLLLDELV